MLVITRSKVEKYPDEIESEKQYKKRLLYDYSIDGFDYHAGTIYRGKSQELLLNCASGEYAKTLSDWHGPGDLEWKEVEKD